MADHLPKAMLIDLDDTILAYEPVASDALRAVCDAPRRQATRLDGRAARRRARFLPAVVLV